MLYMVTFTMNIPQMLAYIPAPWILWDTPWLPVLLVSGHWPYISPWREAFLMSALTRMKLLPAVRPEPEVRRSNEWRKIRKNTVDFFENMEDPL